MTLAPGTRIGPYEVLAPLGAGGMGEVFRARDARLGRDVAIKALPPAFAQDAERLARFEREARLLASLNHPNVAGIHGIEEVAGARYLVLEFVDGETLAARIERGALPVDEAVEICRQVAAGVEAAHEAGVVHRDLKPGNIMVKADGAVKVLDFGLAKSGGSDRPGSDADLAQSPTLTYQGTVAGVVLGTAAYMSPEQARGRAVDKRSDVWSFGCVLYECLTGKQAFHGETVSDTIASILKSEPDFTALPADLPPRLRRLLLRCLDKSPRDRLRDIGEARVVLSAVHDGIPEMEPRSTPSRGRAVPLWLAVAGVVLFAALGAVVASFLRPDSGPAPPRRYDLVADGVERDWYHTPTLSPDGRRIAYIARDRLWLRDLEQVDPRPVADLAGPTPCAWSPDSRLLVYSDAGKLWRVGLDGDAPRAICEIPGTEEVIGAAVSPGGIVAFAVWRGGMYRVSVDGGAPSLMFDIDSEEMVDFHYPSWLPGDKLLYMIHWRERLDSTRTRKPDLMVYDGSGSRPVAGDFDIACTMPIPVGSWLLFQRREDNFGFWAAPFDAGAARVTGKPVLVEPRAMSVSVSNDGSLLYVEKAQTDGRSQLFWVDRNGKPVEPVGEARQGLTQATISPDGGRIAFTTDSEEQGADIWVRDLARSIDTRITFETGQDRDPLWLDANHLVYAEIRANKASLVVVRADGAGGRRVLAPALGFGMQRALVAPDGRSALRLIDEKGRIVLRSSEVLADGSLGPPQPFFRIQPEPDVGEAGLSPDGRLVAYTTDEISRPDAYLTRYPAGEGRWQVSQNRGRQVRWARRTGALYFIAGGGQTSRSVVEVKVDADQDPPFSARTKLFDIDPNWLRFGRVPFDVAPDGSRFLFARPSEDAERRTDRMVLVRNWEAAIARKP